MEQLDYKQLVVKQLAGEMTAAEEKQLKDWLAASPQNEAAFREMQLVWEKTAPAGGPEMPHLDEEWLRLENKLGLKQRSAIRAMPQKPSAESIRHVSSGFRWQRYAVAATILFAAIGLAWWLGQFGQNRLVEVATQNAETKTVTLTDGSAITLNSASKISYFESFSDSVRQIRLTGEAYFDVASEQRPFVVLTENARIGVLGTAFNIWARESETRVVVSEGRVAFQSAAHADTGIVLTANQMSVCRGNGQPETALTVNTDTLLGWREGRIVFNETRLREVAAELQRIYNAEIALASPGLSELSISGTFQKKPLEEVLNAICLTLGVKYRFEEEKYIIY